MSNIVIPEGVTSIGAEAFGWCEQLEEIHIPEGVTSIGANAFYGVPITDIVLPETLSVLGDGAFAYCEKLENVTIPKNVENLGYQIFIGNTKLKGIWVDEDNPWFCSDKKGVVYNKKMTKLIMAPGTIESYEIPESVTAIEEGAFIRCEKLKSVTMKKGVKTIGGWAFAFCEDLKQINIPNGIKCISEYMFYFCESMSDIDLPDSITTIDVRAFSNCNGITQMTLPKNLKSIQNYAFMEDYNLEKVIFKGDAPEEITRSAFGYASIKAYYPGNNKTWTKNKLKTYPEDLEWITYATEGTTFKNKSLNAEFKVTKAMETVAYVGSTNKKATSITIPKTVKKDGITYKITSLNKNAFKNNKKLEKVTVGNNVTTIGASAFQGCAALKTVKIGSKVTNINQKAFYGCSKLANLTIGQNVTTIEASAFQNCTSLKKFTIPSKVKKIGEKAFYGDKKVTSITIKTSKLTAGNVGKQAFTTVGSNNYKKLTVTVPKSKFKAYKTLLNNKGLSKKATISKCLVSGWILSTPFLLYNCS